MSRLECKVCLRVVLTVRIILTSAQTHSLMIFLLPRARTLRLSVPKAVLPLKDIDKRRAWIM